MGHAGTKQLFTTRGSKLTARAGFYLATPESASVRPPSVLSPLHELRPVGAHVARCQVPRQTLLSLEMHRRTSLLGVGDTRTGTAGARLHLRTKPLKRGHAGAGVQPSTRARGKAGAVPALGSSPGLPAVLAPPGSFDEILSPTQSLPRTHTPAAAAAASARRGNPGGRHPSGPETKPEASRAGWRKAPSRGGSPPERSSTCDRTQGPAAG